MRISFYPAGDFPSPEAPEMLSLSRHGDVLTINGDPIDFSAIPDGATLPAGAIDNEWIVGPVERIDGVLHVTVVLPISATTIEPALCFPEPIVVTEDGPVDVPVDTTVTVEEQAVEGGVNVITTTKRWRQEPEVVVEFIPAPEPVIAEEPDHAD